MAEVDALERFIKLTPEQKSVWKQLQFFLDALAVSKNTSSVRTAEDLKLEIKDLQTQMLADAGFVPSEAIMRELQAKAQALLDLRSTSN